MMRKTFSSYFSFLLLIFLFLPSYSYASRTINSATLNNTSSITVDPNESISATVTVTLNGGGSDRYRSTAWRIGNSGAYQCANHSNSTGNGTYTKNFSIIAPSTTGTYPVSFIAYSNDDCSSGASSVYTLNNSVIVRSLPSLTISNTSLSEGNSGSNMMNFTVTLSQSATVSVYYATFNGTATTTGSDYSSRSGTLYFTLGGATTQTISVPILGDTIVESDETLSVVLSSPSGATITTSTGIGTIINDDIDILTMSNPRTFSLVSGFPYNTIGDMKIIGNSIMAQKNGTDGNWTCPGNSTNNYIDVTYVDIDNDASTFNSSSSELIFPKSVSKNDVIWAGLYWQGYLVKDNANKTNANRVLFKTPTSSSYTTITSDTSKFNWIYINSSTTDNRFYYQGVADITDRVKSAGEGNYTVGNIYSSTLDGYTQAERNTVGGAFGAWSMVVVYKDSNTTLKNIAVYDGYISIGTVGATASGPVFKDYNITLSGFLTPSSGTVKSNFLVFAGEGDLGSTGDSTKLSRGNDLTDLVTLYNGLNPSNDTYNASVTNNGVAVTTRNPQCSNTIGIDIDSFDIGSTANGTTQGQIIQNGQTQTRVNLTSAGDGYFPGVFAFSTELYAPKFCYDYAYSQNSQYFTEANSGISTPRIQGHITTTDDINVTFYVRNEEASDVEARNLTLDITDINTSQAIYKRNTVSVIDPGAILPTSIPDGSLSVSDAQIRNIPHGNIYGSEYFYTYYALTPQGISDINISLNATINYTLILNAGGTTISLPYSYTAGSTNFPMCSGDITRYEPKWGTFNIATKGIYNNSDTYPKFNIPTQVVKRPGEYLITAHDANSTPVAYTRELTIPTVIGVELIDAGKFHSTKASCDEPSSAISERFWVPFVDTTGAKSQVDFKTALQNAITQGSISITNIKDYFKEARQNTAFRIISNVKDENNTIIQYEKLASGKYRMLNFPELVQTYGTCKQPVRMAPYGSNNNMTTNQVAVACGNAGESGVDYFTLGQCHECILGYRTIYTCARDNFATRPESFNVKLSDVNQTDHNKTQHFADDRTGVAIPNNNKIDIATGYAYRFDINATNHDDNNASSGYTRYFSTAASDHNISFVWQPLTPTNPSAKCNDLSSKPLTFSIVNGTIMGEANLTNVGEYRLNMIDANWTIVDNDPNYMTHHRSASIKNITTDVSRYFVGSGYALDCQEKSSQTQSSSTLPSISGNTLTNINGCTIDTNNHNNNEANLQYRDYNVSAHPYHFLFTLSPSYGVDSNTSFMNAWIYMNDLNDSNNVNKHADINESMHFRGTILAAGYDNTGMTNFVTGCYAQDINISLDYNYSTPSSIPYKFRLFDLNSTGNIISTVPSLATSLGDANTTIMLKEGNFTKDLNGAISIDHYLNFERNVSNPINPMIVIFNDLNATCWNEANCTMQANLKSTYSTDGNLTLDVNLTHYYGRVYSTDYKDPSPIDTTIRYEVYCDDNCVGFNFNIMGAQSPTSLRWYQNVLHDSLADGHVTAFTSVSAGTAKATTINPIATQNNGITDGLENHNAHLTNVNAPYTDRIRMLPSSWLLFNPFNANALTNDFNVEFINSGNWAGQGQLGQTVDVNTSTRTNRRMEW